VEKDPELLKNTGWIRGQSYEINTAIDTHNAHIKSAMQTAAHQGGLKFAELFSILHFQRSLADAECLLSLELFQKLLDTEKRLEVINNTYQIDAPKTKATFPDELEPVLTQLSKIVETT
jgi:hypothetical protein